jgi:D-inositol-3-phosphate glycosyltransferase
MVKNVIILGPAYPYRGGIAAFDDRLADALQKEGVEVKIITFKLQYPSFLFPGKTQFLPDVLPESSPNEQLINSINPFNWLKTGRYIRSLNPELLIVSYWMPFIAPAYGIILRMAKKNKNIRILSILHNIVPHSFFPGNKLLSRFFTRPCDAHIALSKSVLSDLKDIDPLKPALYNPHPLYNQYGDKIDRKEAITRLGLDPEYRYILFFGLIRDYKGLDWLIEAFALANFQNQKVKLLIAGEFYSDEEKYRKLIASLKIEDRIEVHNRFIPDSEVCYYFGAADLIAQPYKSATQSGVTQIGYHFEKPMLVTNVGGLAEIIPDGKVGYVVEPNPQAIAEKLGDFFINQRYDSFIDHLKEEKKKYAWDKMTGTIKELCEKIN